MKLLFLGTGTSDGIPLIGCQCKVCQSEENKNKRLRSSILIQHNSKNLLIDCSTDFRQQALNNKIDHIDAILFTHPHADHINGIDDLRVLSKKESIPCFGNDFLCDALRHRYSYLFKESKWKSKMTQITLEPIKDRSLSLFGINIIPIPVKHGCMDILGFRINSTAYITDASAIPEASFELLNNLDTLIINALRYKPHPTHFSIAETVEVIRRINPKQAYLTHMNHDIDHFQLEKELDKKIKPAFDGLSIEI